jgi:hypothetical protein
MDYATGKTARTAAIQVDEPFIEKLSRGFVGSEHNALHGTSTGRSR